MIQDTVEGSGMQVRHTTKEDALTIDIRVITARTRMLEAPEQDPGMQQE